MAAFLVEKTSNMNCQQYYWNYKGEYEIFYKSCRKTSGKQKEFGQTSRAGILAKLKFGN